VLGVSKENILILCESSMEIKRVSERESEKNDVKNEVITSSCMGVRERERKRSIDGFGRHIYEYQSELIFMCEMSAIFISLISSLSMNLIFECLFIYAEHHHAVHVGVSG
jgi:hypothetical protein